MNEMLATILYKGNKIFDSLSKIFENTYAYPIRIQQGSIGPANFGLSAAHPVTGAPKAKISLFSQFIELAEQHKISAVFFKELDTAYVEFDLDGNIGAATFDGVTVKFVGEASPFTSLPEATILPIAAYWMARGTEVALEVSKYFQTSGSELKTKLEHLYRCNDSFYYETSKTIVTVTVVDGLTAEEIKCAARTNTVLPIAALEFADLAEMKLINPKEVVSEEAPSAPTCSEFNSIKKGAKLLDPMTWEVEQRSFIPSLKSLEEFVPCQQFYDVVGMVDYTFKKVMKRMQDGLSGRDAIKNDYCNIQMVGRPGTGKTTLANAVGATFGIPVRVVACSKNTEEDTFTGLTKVVSGGFKFCETPFMDAYKNGGIIILEEFNLSDPGVMMGALGQAIEKPFILLEDGVREIHRHPLCIIIATMNVGTQGAREPSEALTSRMPNVFLLDDPNDEDFVNILIKNTECKKTTAKRTFKIYKKILDYLLDPSINEDGVALRITLRHCIAAIRMQEYGVEFKNSIKNTMIGTIAGSDVDLARRVYEDVVMTARD